MLLQWIEDTATGGLVVVALEGWLAKGRGDTAGSSYCWRQLVPEPFVFQ